MLEQQLHADHQKHDAGQQIHIGKIKRGAVGQRAAEGKGIEQAGDDQNDSVAAAVVVQAPVGIFPDAVGAENKDADEDSAKVQNVGGNGKGDFSEFQDQQNDFADDHAVKRVAVSVSAYTELALVIFRPDLPVVVGDENQGEGQNQADQNTDGQSGGLHYIYTHSFILL